MSVRVRFNTYYLFSEKEFIAENGEVMIPVDVIADALSVTLLWNETEKAATMSRYDRMVTITADDDTAVVNGEEKALTIKARMVEDTFYVPLTFIAEAFLARVEWVEYSKTAIVTDNVNQFCTVGSVKYKIKNHTHQKYTNHCIKCRICILKNKC